MDLGSSLVVAKVIVGYLKHRTGGLLIRIGEFIALRRKAQIRGIIYFENESSKNNRTKIHSQTS